MGPIPEPVVVFENKDVLVIDKPAGMIVNRSETVPGAFTLQDWMERRYGQQSLGAGERHGLVHRLDKETSGLMVMAKNTASYHHLVAQFKERHVSKEYLTLVHGRIAPANGNIRLPIRRDPKNRRRFSVWVGGKMSETNYRTLSSWENPKEKIKSKKYYTLMSVQLKTGRTHQIRVHMAHLRHPVVSDDVYGGRKTSRSDRSWCPRLFLHSTVLGFTDHHHCRFQFKLPLAPDLAFALQYKLVIIHHYAD